MLELVLYLDNCVVQNLLRHGNSSPSTTHHRRHRPPLPAVRSLQCLARRDSEPKHNININNTIEQHSTATTAALLSPLTL